MAAAPCLLISGSTQSQICQIILHLISSCRSLLIGVLTFYRVALYSLLVIFCGIFLHTNDLELSVIFIIKYILYLISLNGFLQNHEPD